MDRLEDPRATRLLEVIRETLVELREPQRAARATLDSSLESDLGLDSLARVELLLRVEHAFGVTLPENTLQVAQTARDLLTALDSAQPVARPGPAAERHAVSVPAGLQEEPIEARTLIEVLNSRNDYSNFMLRQLPKHINTSYALIVQWDGYVVDASAWKPEFRDYDYIGARWTWFDDGMTVGNGGFSLRSQKLLRALRDPRFSIVPGVNEDELICRDYRRTLEREHGIRFAPESVADLFSYERTSPAGPTFGFHGLFNMWRHTK
ncbi:MAG: DUF5672 family protein, partial [Burkholderiales bacterium]